MRKTMLEYVQSDVEATKELLKEQYRRMSELQEPTIYIAGSLFSEAEQVQRKKEGRDLREQLDDKGLIVEVFNPIENEFNDKSVLPTHEDIFRGDTKQMIDSTHILVNLDNQLDAGVFTELGQLYEMMEVGMVKKIYPVISDMRKSTAGEYNEEEIPWGINQYPMGLLSMLGNNVIYSSSKDAIEAMVKDIVRDSSQSKEGGIFSVGATVKVVDSITEMWTGNYKYSEEMETRDWEVLESEGNEITIRLKNGEEEVEEEEEEEEEEMYHEVVWKF